MYTKVTIEINDTTESALERLTHQLWKKQYRSHPLSLVFEELLQEYCDSELLYDVENKINNVENDIEDTELTSAIGSVHSALKRLTCILSEEEIHSILEDIIKKINQKLEEQEDIEDAN